MALQLCTTFYQVYDFIIIPNAQSRFEDGKVPRKLVRKHAQLKQHTHTESGASEPNYNMRRVTICPSSPVLVKVMVV